MIHIERRRYGPHHGERSAIEAIHAGRERDRQKYLLSDLILVPSDFVRDAVLALGAEPSKISLVPYGIDRRRLELPSRPIQGRILFVGSVGLRKGSHYLAEAARCLALRRIRCEVRVVGPVGRDIASQPLFAGPTYAGQIPRSEIHREFAQADVFVLPSIAEGMAIATLEAMAAGLPVVTTRNAGSCIRDGIDGFIVAAGDAASLASAIGRIIADRPLRETMSQNARERAAEFT